METVVTAIRQNPDGSQNILTSIASAFPISSDGKKRIKLSLPGHMIDGWVAAEEADRIYSESFQSDKQSAIMRFSYQKSLGEAFITAKLRVSSIQSIELVEYLDKGID